VPQETQGKRAITVRVVEAWCGAGAPSRPDPTPGVPPQLYSRIRTCVAGSAIGVELSYVRHYQRSGNSYSGNGTKESIGSSSQDSSVCGALPTSGFTWSY